VVIWAIRKKIGVRHVIANVLTTTFLILALIWSRARANIRYGHHPPNKHYQYETGCRRVDSIVNVRADYFRRSEFEICSLGY
jgi:hypothetical protein